MNRLIAHVISVGEVSKLFEHLLFSLLAHFLDDIFVVLLCVGLYGLKFSAEADACVFVNRLLKVSGLPLHRLEPERVSLKLVV